MLAVEDVELIKGDEKAVTQDNLEKSQDSEENQLKQVQDIEKNMQEQQEEGFSYLSTCLTNDFIGFEDDPQEYSRISEKGKNLKNWVEIMNTMSNDNGSDIEFSTNDRYGVSGNIGKNDTLFGRGIPQDDNNNGEVCSPAKKIRCKSINDLLEKSKIDRNHVTSDSQTTPNLSPKFSYDKDSQVLSKSFHNKSVPKNDQITLIMSEKSVITPSDAENIRRTIVNSKLGTSTASFTISNQKISQKNSKFNRATMIPKLLNTDSQVPKLPISSSIYSNPPMSSIYPSPYMFNAMPSCSNYMQQGMNSSIGMNSFPVATPQRLQPPSSFVFDKFNSPITLSQFPNVYSYIRNKQPIVRINDSSFTISRDAQNITCSSTPSAPTEAGFMCKYCSFTFINKELFNEHLHAGLCSGLVRKTGTNDKYHDKEKEIGTKQVVYACHICEKSFDEKDELNSHEMERHNLLSPHEKTLKKIDNLHSKRYSCAICHKHFILSKELFLHLKECHSITNIKDCIPDQSFSLQNKNSHNNSYASSKPHNDNLSQSMLMSNSLMPEIKEEGTPAFNTNAPTSSSLSTISTSSCGITTNSVLKQISKCKSKCSPAITTSSTTSTTSSLSRTSITSNANEFSTHEMNQVTAEDKTASNVANSESNTGSTITCPGCSFTFMGDHLFSQHLKAGLCSKLLTDTISKKFPGYTVCNIKKKEQNKSTEDQNVLLKKIIDKYHKLYMCELCSAKFTTKEMLLTHRKSAHKVSNLYPVPTMLTGKSIQNQIDGEVTNDRLMNQTNHTSTQNSTSEVLTATSQSEILQNVNIIYTKPLSSVKQITKIRADSHVESNMNDSINCVSKHTSLLESPQDMSKNSEISRSHELELEVKRMEFEAWKSWKEACDLQVQFWRNKLGSQEENNNHGKSSEIEHENASNTFIELNDINIKHEEENTC